MTIPIFSSENDTNVPQPLYQQYVIHCATNANVFKVEGNGELFNEAKGILSRSEYICSFNYDGNAEMRGIFQMLLNHFSEHIESKERFYGYSLHYSEAQQNHLIMCSCGKSVIPFYISGRIMTTKVCGESLTEWLSKINFAFLHLSGFGQYRYEEKYEHEEVIKDPIDYCDF